jgi:hypothetical protein
LPSAGWKKQSAGAAVGRSEGDALLAIALAYRSYAKENPELYKAILRFPDCGDSDVQEKGHTVVRILYQVMEPYYLGEEETIHFVRGFRSALHGFVSLEAAGFFRGNGAGRRRKLPPACCSSDFIFKYGKEELIWVLILPYPLLGLS